MTYAYLRHAFPLDKLSTQRAIITDYCQQHGILIDQWIEEGQRKPRRPNNEILTQLLSQMQPKDLLLTSEVVNLGDSLHTFLDALSQCMHRGASIHTVTDGYHFDNATQSSSISDAVSSLSGLAREFHAQRTKDNIEARRAKGERIGRPFGIHTSPAKQKLQDNLPLIREQLASGARRDDLAKQYGVSPSTFQHFIKANL